MSQKNAEKPVKILSSFYRVVEAAVVFQVYRTGVRRGNEIISFRVILVGSVTPKCSQKLAGLSDFDEDIPGYQRNCFKPLIAVICDRH